MGASGSTLKIPGLSSTECVAYSTGRKHAAKDLLAADKALSDAARAYSEALKGAGSSLVVFCAGTSLYAGTSLGALTRGPDSQASFPAQPVPGGPGTFPGYGMPVEAQAAHSAVPPGYHIPGAAQHSAAPVYPPGVVPAGMHTQSGAYQQQQQYEQQQQYQQYEQQQQQQYQQYHQAPPMPHAPPPSPPPLEHSEEASDNHQGRPPPSQTQYQRFPFLASSPDEPHVSNQEGALSSSHRPDLYPPLPPPPGRSRKGQQAYPNPYPPAPAETGSSEGDEWETGGAPARPFSFHPGEEVYTSGDMEAPLAPRQASRGSKGRGREATREEEDEEEEDEYPDGPPPRDTGRQGKVSGSSRGRGRAEAEEEEEEGGGGGVDISSREAEYFRRHLARGLDDDDDEEDEEEYVPEKAETSRRPGPPEAREAPDTSHERLGMPAAPGAAAAVPPAEARGAGASGSNTNGDAPERMEPAPHQAYPGPGLPGASSSEAPLHSEAPPPAFHHNGVPVWHGTPGSYPAAQSVHHSGQPVPVPGIPPVQPGPVQPAVASIQPWSAPAPSGAMLGERTLDQYAKRLSALFVEAAALTQPVIEVLGLGTPLGKTTCPPLAAGSARGLDGRVEPVGQTLQKLVNWERKLKEDVKVMERIRSGLRKNDKRLQRHTSSSAKKPGQDLRRVESAQRKVHDAHARLATVTASVGHTYNELEHFKADLLLPQLLRILPAFVEMWRASADVFSQQHAVSQQLAMHEGPQGHGPQGPAGPGGAPRAYPPSGGVGFPLSGSAFAESLGGAGSAGTTKAQHEATKKLEDAFKKLHSSISALGKAQKAYSSAVLAWLAKTYAFPASFPRPPPGAPPPGQYVASWSAAAQEQAAPQQQVVVSKDHLFSALCGDWARMLDALPESEVHHAVSGFCEWLAQAHDLQKQEMRQARRLEDALKQLNKVEQKLSVAQQKEHELRLAVAAGGEVEAGHEKEHQVREAQAAAAAAEVAAVKGTVESSRHKVGSEKVALERLQAGGRGAMAAALQKGHPLVCQQAAHYASCACQGYRLLQDQHAPWLAQPSAPAPA